MRLIHIRSPGVYNTMPIKRIISGLRTEQYAVKAVSVRVNRVFKDELKLYTGIPWPGSIERDGHDHTCTTGPALEGDSDLLATSEIMTGSKSLSFTGASAQSGPPRPMIPSTQR